MKKFLSAPLVLALAAAGTVHAQGFSLEGAVIDSRSARSLGVLNESGDINTLFRAQKAMTFGILRSAGISLEQLSPEVRARIERFATTNLEAFRAFSQGLDLKDQGRFGEAKAEFARAARLDPGFALASEQQQAMPEVNLGSGVQTRAVVLAAAGAAVDRGKAGVVVDTARAVAALAAGQSVSVVTVASADAARNSSDYSTTPPGSGTQFVPNRVVGLAYTVPLQPGNTPYSLALTAEWKSESFRVAGTALESLGKQGTFQAERDKATQGTVTTAALADGTTAYWGSWLPSAEGTGKVTVLSSNNTTQTLSTEGAVNYLMAEATRVMPSAGTAEFAASPTGTLADNTGRVRVDFVTQKVDLIGLGFKIGDKTFTALQGTADYSKTVASGTFGGNYTAGLCTGCAAFTPGSSRFDGSFVGRAADGLVFSTFMSTGPGTSVSGVQLFTKQP